MSLPLILASSKVRAIVEKEVYGGNTIQATNITNLSFRIFLPGKVVWVVMII